MIAIIYLVVDLVYILGNALLTYLNVNDGGIKLLCAIFYAFTTFFVRWKLNNLSKSTMLAAIVHILFICSLVIL